MKNIDLTNVEQMTNEEILNLWEELKREYERISAPPAHCIEQMTTEERLNLWEKLKREYEASPAYCEEFLESLNSIKSISVDN